MVATAHHKLAVAKAEADASPTPTAHRQAFAQADARSAQALLPAAQGTLR
ncbi:MAG TPA: hypothetical protein VFE60_03305 [Roseiarcus sp.]|nr:hypothetical protein [Roseiarcus sp.]